MTGNGRMISGLCVNDAGVRRPGICLMNELQDLGLKRADVVTVRPGDVVALIFNGGIDEESVEQIKTICRKFWPENEVMILGDGARVQVFRPEFLQ